MILPSARDGDDVVVKGRKINFSFWPTARGSRREGLSWTLFSSDPWHLVQSNLRSMVDDAARLEAIALMSQARDFYRSSVSSDINAAKPLLLYYSFLNLAKCLSIYRGSMLAGDRVRHGLTERLPTASGSIHGNIGIQRSLDATSAFAKFSSSIGESLPPITPPSQDAEMRSQDFLAQILIGHRVWCLGENINERFISVQGITYRHDAASKQMWLWVRMIKDDLQRLGYSQAAVARALTSRAGCSFKSVACADLDAGRKLVEFESENTVAYPNRPSEALKDASDLIIPALWRSVTSFPPYRKYYVYIPTSSQTLLSQLQSLYIATYYFGSITRYKPSQFESILNSDIGSFVQEFFTNQPAQILYLMVSEFAKQEVTKAAIV